MKKKNLNAVLILISLGLVGILTSLLIAVPSITTVPLPVSESVQCSNSQIGGFAYIDYNSNGRFESPEPGVSNLTVTAFNDSNSVVASALTDGGGNYLLNVPSGKYRVELSDVPAYLKAGFHGEDSVTTVTIANTGSCNISFALSSPSEFCNDNPEVATSTYVSGDPLANGTCGIGTSAVTFPYNASGFSNSPLSIAIQSQTGPTWGIAYQRSTKKLFLASVMKRHSGFGPLGTGGIYQVDYSNPAAPTVANFIDVKTIGIDTGVDPRTILGDPGLPANAEDPSIDPNAFSAIGKVGFGDLEISEDEKTLWFVNLATRTLHSVYVGLPAQVPSSADVQSFAIPNPGCADGEFRPWAVKIHQGAAYVGVTCSAEASQDATALHAYVLKLNGNSFNTVLDFPLTYVKGFGINPLLGPIPDPGYNWKPWARDINDIGAAFPGFSFVIYPQAILSGIEFDFRNGMIINLMDRSGNSFGPMNYLPPPYETSTVNAPSAGDMLYACVVGSDSWEIENNASCSGVVPSAGAGNNQGPGGGEFFSQDNLYSSVFKVDIHQELMLGSSIYKPGSREVLSTMYDGFDFEDNSIGTFSLDDGGVLNKYQIFDIFLPGAFGKAVGVGDLELLCQAAPVEIGNFIWFDNDRDGIQDPSENGIAGVTVNLYDSNTNVLVATKITSADGSYYFNTQDGVVSGKSYFIKLDKSSDFTLGGPLFELVLTNKDQGQDNHDSDAELMGTSPFISVVAGEAGNSVHTYDFGFVTELLCTTESFESQVRQIDGNSVGLYKYARLMAQEINKNNPSEKAQRKAQKLLRRANNLQVKIWQSVNLELPQQSVTCGEALACATVQTESTTTIIKTDSKKMLSILQKMKSLANTKFANAIFAAAQKLHVDTKILTSQFPKVVNNCQP